MQLFIVFLVLAVFAGADKVSYENYKVFRMMVRSDDEVMFLKNLVESREGFTFWSGLSTSIPTAIMVAPGDLGEFTERMVASGIKYEMFVENVQELIDRQIAGSGGNEKGFNWKRYHTLDEIYDWLDSLQKKYPRKVEIIIGGRTYEGRQIKGVKISFRKDNSGIFIESGIHSYEWLTPATSTYLINEFLTSKDPSILKLAESHDWYIFPSFNPDGYAYTHSTNRMWSKTRSQSNSACMGADLNRNWDYMWMQGGSSDNPCEKNYAGKSAFSEIEAKTISEYIESIKDKLFAYISFHSFAQLLMVPYGYTKEHLDNYNETYAIGLKAANALAQRYGTKYKVGNIAEAIYPASGTSMDWIKGTLKLPIVYTYELRDQGNYGMLLPPEQIIPNCQEVLDSLIVMFEEALKLGYPKSKS